MKRIMLYLLARQLYRNTWISDLKEVIHTVKCSTNKKLDHIV